MLNIIIITSLASSSNSTIGCGVSSRRKDGSHGVIRLAPVVDVSHSFPGANSKPRSFIVGRFFCFLGKGVYLGITHTQYIPISETGAVG